MASTKIQNLPLKAPIGAMKIPTGGFGDYSITVSSIGDFIIDTFNLATKDYVDTLLVEKEDRIDLTGGYLTPTSQNASVPDTNNDVIDEVAQALLDRIEYVKDNFSAAPSHNELTGRSATGAHPSTSISHKSGTVYSYLQQNESDINNINNVSIPTINQTLLDKQDLITTGSALNPVAVQSPVPSVSHTGLNSAIQALLNRTAFFSNHSNLTNRSDINSHPASSISTTNNISQQDFNNLLSSFYNPITLKYSDSDLSSIFTTTLNSLITNISNSGGGTISIPDGLFFIDASIGIELKDNVELRFGKNTILKASSNSLNSYELIRIHDRTNVKISGGVIDGNRLQQTSNTGVVYKDWKPNTTYAVGDCIVLQRMGAQVTVAGTTGSTPPTIVKETNGLVKIGISYTDGTCQYTSIQDVGEWGMGISIRGGKTVDISDIQINNCWGDAIYIGRTSAKAYAEDVTLRNIRMDNNRRQGISVVSLITSNWYNIHIYNTYGTDPQSGVDFEPNASDEFLLNILINGLHTYNSNGHGLHAWFAPFDSLTHDEDKVGITINNFTDIGSTRNIYISTTRTSFAKGYIVINDANLKNSKNGSIYHESCNADGVQFYLNRPYIETNDVVAKAPIRSGIASNSTIVCGGIHIYKPRIKQLGDKYETSFILSNSNGNLNGFKNISLIDPIEMDANNTTNQGNYILCSQKIDNLNISDNFNFSKKDVNGYSYEIFHNYMKYFLSSTDTSGRTLSITSVKKGRKFSVSNENASQFLTINFSSSIVVIDNSVSGTTTSLQLTKQNSYIEFECVSDDVVRIVRKTSDIKNPSKILSYTYDWTSINAGATAFVDVPWSGTVTGDFFEATMNTSLSGLCIKAQCLSAGTVRVFLSNISTAPIDLPSANIRLKMLD